MFSLDKNGKMRVIRLSQEQLHEVAASNYEYLSDIQLKPYNGQSEVSANGAMGISEPGAPTTTDDTGKNITPQGYNRFGTGYRPYYYREVDTDLNDYDELSESIYLNEEDKNNDNVDDYYENDQSMDILSDGNPNDNLVKIPVGVQNKLEALITTMRSANLSPKACAIVAIKFLKDMNTSALPYNWKRYIRTLIN